VGVVVPTRMARVGFVGWLGGLGHSDQVVVALNTTQDKCGTARELRRTFPSRVSVLHVQPWGISTVLNQALVHVGRSGTSGHARTRDGWWCDCCVVLRCVALLWCGVVGVCAEQRECPPHLLAHTPLPCLQAPHGYCSNPLRCMHGQYMWTPCAQRVLPAIPLLPAPPFRTVTTGSKVNMRPRGCVVLGTPCASGMYQRCNEQVGTLSMHVLGAGGGRLCPTCA